MDFFVIGTSRSGSTLLRDMLAAHPDVAILNESHWVPRMWESFGSGITQIEKLISIVKLTKWDTGQRVVDVNLELAGKTWSSLVEGLRARLGDETSVAAFHDALVDEIFGVAAGSIRRGDKTPDYGFYMATMQLLWPEAKFVNIVRNGIDTARSMSLHSGCQLMISAGYDNWVPLSYDHMYLRYHRFELPFGSYAASWRRRMDCIRQESVLLRKGSYLEVRYETLLSEPAQVLQEVAAHLNLAVTDPWLNQCSGLIRPRPLTEPVTAQTLRTLTLDDIRAMNDVGGVAFFPFPPHADLDCLWSALDRKQAVPFKPDSGDSIQVAIGVLATQTAAQHPDLLSSAVALLREAVTASGDDVSRWAVFPAVAERLSPADYDHYA